MSLDTEDFDTRILRLKIHHCFYCVALGKLSDCFAPSFLHSKMTVLRAPQISKASSSFCHTLRTQSLPAFSNFTFP